jgi:hypothetical protein
MFHSSAARRPCAVPEATASGAGSAITPNDHVADPGGPGEITRDRTVRPVDQEDAAEHAIDLQGDQPWGGYRVEYRRHGAGQKQRWETDHKWQRDRERQPR